MKELEVKDWRGKVWRIQFQVHHQDELAIDWRLIAPDGSIKSEIESDRELPRRCLNQFRQLDDYWLVWEFKWWVNHYTNTLDLKKLKARRCDRD